MIHRSPVVFNKITAVMNSLKLVTSDIIILLNKVDFDLGPHVSAYFFELQEESDHDFLMHLINLICDFEICMC